MVKFLIIRFSSIGDIVLTSPVIRCLKEQVEDSVIHYVTKDQFSSILEHNPYIDKIHTLKENLPGLIEELQKECFDYVIDLHHNLRSGRMKSKLKLASFSLDKLNFKKWMYVNFKKPPLPDIHIVDRYLATIRVFDVVNDEKGLDFFITPTDTDSRDMIGADADQMYGVLVVGAKFFTKQLPEKKMIEMCNGLNFPIVLIGGKEDIQKGEAIVNQSTGTITNLCGKLTLSQSAAVVRDAKVVITHDTGMMHIASAFSKPILSIWGNTVPEFGMYPYMPYPGSQMFQVELKCRPCTKIGFRECPKKHFRCMETIPVEEIIQKAKYIYNN